MDKLSATLVSVLMLILISACSSTTKKTGSDGASIPPHIAKLNGSYLVKCNGAVMNMGDIIRPIAHEMTNQNISYSISTIEEWRDCSGNFLRFSSYIADKCPDQAKHLAAPAGIKPFAEGGFNLRPGKEKARSTRALAKWYHKQGRFTPIYYDTAARIGQPSNDLIRNRNRIRVGSVLWFSIGKPRAEDGLNGLFIKKKGDDHGPHINHMSIVTSVKYDEQGNVSRFEMYHGRSPSKPAGVTKSHFWKWPSNYLKGGKKEYPPFGFWEQYLVGVGDILPSL